MNIRTIFHFFLYMSQPRVFIIKTISRFPWAFSDKLYIKLLYRSQMGVWPNLNEPKSFTEKINWLKLYNRKPEYTLMVDKYHVKNYVASIIGSKYIIPTIAVWNSLEEINWESLPNQFVLKTTNGGGSTGVVLCRDKKKLDINDCINKLSKSLKSNNYLYYREWPYKNVHKRIIAEKLLCDSCNESLELIDYKFFCFNGEPIYCQVIRDRHSIETIDFYDMKWNHMPFIGLVPAKSSLTINNGLKPVERPKKLEEMIQISRQLSRNIPFLRVDLYYVNNEVYFGEMTFFPASGIWSFYPIEWDMKIGNLLNLSMINN